MSSRARMLSLAVPGPVGELEAVLRSPALPAGAAVIAHPHPLFGGTMHNKVVHRAARFLSDRLGLAALRFNFRGVGTSDGVHDDGRGETEDLLAACRFLRARQPSGPFVLGGFSFGSLCAIRAARTARPDVLYLIGVPLDRWDEGVARGLRATRIVWVQGEDDEFGAGPRAVGAAARLGAELRTVPGADHFFTGSLAAFEEASLGLLRAAGLGGPDGEEDEAEDDDPSSRGG